EGDVVVQILELFEFLNLANGIEDQETVAGIDDIDSERGDVGVMLEVAPNAVGDLAWSYDCDFALIQLEPEQAQDRADGFSHVGRVSVGEHAPVQVEVVRIDVDLMRFEGEGWRNVQRSDAFVSLAADHLGGFGFRDAIQRFGPPEKKLLILEKPEELDRVSGGD